MCGLKNNWGTFREQPFNFLYNYLHVIDYTINGLMRALLICSASICRMSSMERIHLEWELGINLRQKICLMALKHSSWLPNSSTLVRFSHKIVYFTSHYVCSLFANTPKIPSHTWRKRIFLSLLKGVREKSFAILYSWTLAWWW